ncbi:HNH endonuclease [Thermopolyspora sp. NPDC052614]|uniref:HNH endonuclease n=1 Tax=Thermopolyspora sp. NPDC052614 TaxID=3155682 RepID=UPI00344A8D20
MAPGIYSDRHLANDLKQLYSYACQICETVLEIPGGIRFASVAHIRGLELPHSGPDTLSNMLCLCPNHQALFKFGSITIEDDLRVIDQTDGEEIGVLLVRHDIDLEHIRYHREHHKFGHQKLRDQLS